MKFEMSDKAQTIKIYNLRADTHEFIGAGDAYIPPHTGLPANCTVIAPPDIPAGYVAIFSQDSGIWSLVEDHREQTVYDTVTGGSIFITSPGALPDGVTTVAPTGSFQKWNGSDWVTDTQAQHAAEIAQAEDMKAQLLAQAQSTISLWQTKLLLGIISDEDRAALTGWISYIDALQAIDTGQAPDIAWPEPPAV